MQLFTKIAFFWVFVYNISMNKVKIIFFILISFIPCISIYWNETWIPWASFSFWFYSTIHNNIDTSIDMLRTKELKKYSTFSWFWKHCRSEYLPLDRVKMDETLLIELSYGKTSRLLNTIQKNKGSINSDNLISLVWCLTETYKKLWEQAQKDEENLSQISIIWLYTDGNTKNSDYDIMFDIERINSIIFTEKTEYKGTVNTSLSSVTDLWKWQDIPPLAPWLLSQTLPSWSGIANSGTPATDPQIDLKQKDTLKSMGIWSVCSPSHQGEAWKVLPIDSMVDAEFLSEISQILAGQDQVGNSNVWYEYFVPPPPNQPHWSWWQPNSDWDFFDSLPCEAEFCITTKSVKGRASLLAWWKNKSIESLIERHGAIVEPIANSNLSAQKHQKNSFQLPFLNIKFKNQISGGNVYIENLPQIQKKYEKEYTQSMQDEEFNYLQRCAYISAWLPGDIDRANIPSWVWYQFLTTQTTENTIWAKKTLWVLNPDDTSIAKDCMSIAIGQPGEKYYESLSTDLTEIEVFTTWLIAQISRALQGEKKLDTLPIK